jgi:hypothetical protein
MDNIEQDAVQVSVETTTFQRREKIITIKLRAPKDHFAVGELLSKFSKFESVERFFEILIRSGAETYLENARKAISKIESK